MARTSTRGSQKLLAAWKARTLSEDAIQEIAKQLESSPANVEKAQIVGGAHPSGVTLGLSYGADDSDGCGNDLNFWLHWHKKHGGVIQPPRILIDGIPFPDVIRVELDFGQVAPKNAPVPEVAAKLNGV